MLSYLKKDIMFSKQWLLVSLVWGIVCGFVFLKEGGSFIFVDFLLPLFVMYFPLSRLMHLEDPRDTRDFLKRMPQSKYGRVTARIIFVFALLIYATALKIGFKYLLIEGYSITSGMNLQKELFYFFVFLFLNLTALILFYRFSFQIAQNFTLASYAAVFCVAILNKYTEYKISFPQVNALTVIIPGILIGVVLVFLALKAEQVS